MKPFIWHSLGTIVILFLLFVSIEINCLHSITHNIQCKQYNNDTQKACMVSHLNINEAQLQVHFCILQLSATKTNKAQGRSVYHVYQKSELRKFMCTEISIFIKNKQKKNRKLCFGKNNYIAAFSKSRTPAKKNKVKINIPTQNNKIRFGCNFHPQSRDFICSIFSGKISRQFLELCLGIFYKCSLFI